MILLEKIRSDWMEARKKHDAVVANLLGTVIGECDTAAKSGKTEHVLTEADVIKIVQSMRNRISETISLIVNRPERAPDLAKWRIELEQISTYLPQQLSNEALTEIAIGQHSLGLNLGQIMTYLKANHPGRYDAKLALDIVKEII
jgi:uncharacterized protein YqeY